MQSWIAKAQRIGTLDPEWKRKARARLNEQTRPMGSLGLLESLLERLVAIQRKEKPSVARKRILIFAADHGVTEEGVSLYPREVTKAMVANFLNGGATINALARQVQSDVRVIDVGVDADFGREDRLVHSKLGNGTKNMVVTSAMTSLQLDQALLAGWNQVHQAHEERIELLALGEMGIGNTTAASAVIAALMQWPVESATGRGTGLGDEALQNKIAIIKKAHTLHQASFDQPFEILRTVGGFEIAAMVGAILAAANLQIPVVVDGWIVSASALFAVKLNPKILDYLFFAHQSDEYAHRALLQALEVEPILNLSMRLGEASGAALAMGILEAAVRIYNEVATFEEAGVANRTDAPRTEKTLYD
jgi:nicotinate-nucleotide--dimethylbenzimidazole phosphoribosyltransferase